jgi:hypothetical protein
LSLQAGSSNYNTGSMPAAADKAGKKKKGEALPPKPALYTEDEWGLAHSVPRLLELLSVPEKPAPGGSSSKEKPLATKQAVRVYARVCATAATPDAAQAPQWQWCTPLATLQVLHNLHIPAVCRLLQAALWLWQLLSKLPDAKEEALRSKAAEVRCWCSSVCVNSWSCAHQQPAAAACTGTLYALSHTASCKHQADTRTRSAAAVLSQLPT